MPEARVVDVAEAVAAAIAAGPFTDPPIEPASVERVWGFDLEGDRTTGLRVYVFALAYSQPETATRSEDLKEHKVGVVVAERYTGQGEPPKAWVDARARWVEVNVWDRVGDVRGFEAAGNWPDTGDVSVFDPQLLRELKVFYSEVELAFREVK